MLQWAPVGLVNPAGVAAAFVQQTFPLEQQGTRYLGFFLGTFITRVLGQFNTRVSSIVRNGWAREPLRMSQALWAWETHTRSKLEWIWAALPPLDEDDEEMLEEHQFRAYLAMLGDAATPGCQPPYELLLSVLGRRWRLTERRALAQLSYARKLALSRCRPERDALITYFEGLARTSQAFMDSSVTEALLATLARYECSALPAVDDARARDSHARRLFLARKRQRERGGGPLSDVSSCSSGGGSDSDDSSDDELGGGVGCEPELGESHRQNMRRVVGNDATGWLENGVTHLKAARCFKAVDPSDEYLKSCVLQGGADEASAAFPSLLCGCFWPCTLLRGAGAGYDVRKCAGCGAVIHDLDVHFVCGKVKGGSACTCDARLAAVRERYWAGVVDLFAQCGNGDLLAATENGTRERLTMALGGGGLKPQKLALALPAVFVETFGAWARDERKRRADAVA